MAKHIVRMMCDKPNCDHPHDIEVDLPEPESKNEDIAEEPKPKAELIPDEKPKEPQKITIKVPQNNSDKPQVDCVLFNDKYIPKAEVYEI